MNRKTTSTVIILLASVAVFLVFVFIIWINQGRDFNYDNLTLLKQEKIFKEQIDEVNLDIGNMMVEVHAGEGNDVLIDYYANKESDFKDLSVSNQDQTLKLYEEKTYIWDYYLFLIPRKVVITIPSDKICKYDINLRSGKIYLDGVKPEDVSVDLASGYMKADFDQSYESKSFTGEIASGRMYAEGSFQTQDIEVHSGKIVIMNLIQPKQIYAEIHSGDAQIGIPAPDQLAISGEVASGAVTNAFTGQKYDDEIEAQSGSIPVTVDVASGNLVFDENSKIEKEFE